MSHPQDPPYSFLIFDLSRETHRELLRQHCLATTKGQILIFEMHHMGPVSYLRMVNGLVASNLTHMDEEKTNILRNDMAALLFSSAYIYPRLRDVHPPHAPQQLDGRL